VREGLLTDSVIFKYPPPHYYCHTKERFTCRAALPTLASRCVWHEAFSPFLFSSGGPGLAGWILYHAASLVVDACYNKIPPSARPLGFVTIYRPIHKWLLSLLRRSSQPYFCPFLIYPGVGITGRSVGRPQPRGVVRVPAYPPGSTALSCLSRKELAS
jgi:hypothetical protein